MFKNVHLSSVYQKSKKWKKTLSETIEYSLKEIFL